MGNNLGFILKLICSILYYTNKNSDLHSKKFLSSKKMSAALHKTNFRRHNFWIISASGIIFSLNAKCCLSFYSSVHASFLLPFFTRMQGKVFPLNLALKLWGCLKVTHEVPNQTTPKWIAVNWTIQSQIKACIAKSSCEISALLRYYTAMSGNS
jgi:hypothetical protein